MRSKGNDFKNWIDWTEFISDVLSELDELGRYWRLANKLKLKFKGNRRRLKDIDGVIAKIVSKVKRIGRRLNNEGGYRLMSEIWLNVSKKNRDFIDQTWVNIGDWSEY